jgi:hypothetical protein
MEELSDRITRVARVLLAPEQDRIAVELDRVVKRIDAAGRSESAVLREAVGQLQAAGVIERPDPIVLERALARPGPSEGRIFAAAFSVVVSTLFVVGLCAVMPRLANVFESVDVPMPAISVVLERTSRVLVGAWPLVAALLLVEAVVLFRSLRRGWLWLAIRTSAAMVMWFVSFVGALLPILALLEGIGRTR